MGKSPGLLASVCLAFCSLAVADEDPAAGKLLIATDEVQGPTFAQTVILLLHYDETGAMGLVVNQPAEVTPKELLPELEGLKDYSGNVYWGGPVSVASMRALIRSDSPPEDAMPIFDGVYQIPMAEKLPEGASSAEHLRFFIGYAGWAPDQLDRELYFGSWLVQPATEEVVFAKDPSLIWEQLTPPRHYRASVSH